MVEVGEVSLGVEGGELPSCVMNMLAGVRSRWMSELAWMCASPRSTWVRIRVRVKIRVGVRVWARVWVRVWVRVNTPQVGPSVGPRGGIEVGRRLGQPEAC